MFDDSKTPNNWVSFDMEMNNDQDGRVTDIIQMGATCFDITTGKIVDRIKIYVNTPKADKPSLKDFIVDGKKVQVLTPNEPVNPFIVKLTGVTDQLLFEKGKSLFVAYTELQEFVKRNKCFRDAVCWGGNDGLYLKNQLIQHCNWSEESFGKFVFNSNYFDAKKFFQLYCQENNLSMKSGMARSMRRLGLTFVGRIHDALDDAINCAVIFVFLKKKFNEVFNLKVGQSIKLDDIEVSVQSINDDSGEVVLKTSSGLRQTFPMNDICRLVSAQNKVKAGFQ